MHQKVTAPIDETYTASAYSPEILETWYESSHVVGYLAMSTQVLFPVIMTVSLSTFFIYALEFEPYNLGKKLDNELASTDNKIKAKSEAKLSTKFTISVLFHLCTLVADIAALCQYNRLPDKIREFYYSYPRLFWGVPIVMLVFDVVTLVLFILIPPILLLIVPKRKKKWHILTYCLIAPLSCIASHSYHILFAFINDPFHATSILLLYAIVIFVHIQGFPTMYYLIKSICCKSCCPKHHTGQYLTMVVFFITEFIFMTLAISLSLAFLIELPISNAIDEAPNRLYAIYQTSVTFFAALIAFQLLFSETNSNF